MSEPTASLMHDRVTCRAWLTFDSRTPGEVAGALVEKGWRWSGLREAWNHPSMVTRKSPLMPEGIQLRYEGLCDYNSARANMLDKRAGRAAAQGTAHIESARRILAIIPMGEPVKVGHHSQRRHERDLARIDNGMRKGHGLLDYARYVESRAEGSRLRRQQHENPITARNRLERLLKEREEALAAQREDVLEVLDLLIADTQQYAEQALASDTLQPQPGDIVWCGGLELVVKVNPKTLLTVSLHSANWGWESTMDRRKLKRIFSSGNPLPYWTAWYQKDGSTLETCGHSTHKTRAQANKCASEKWPGVPASRTHRSMVMPEELKQVVKDLLDRLQAEKGTTNAA